MAVRFEDVKGSDPGKHCFTHGHNFVIQKTDFKYYRFCSQCGELIYIKIIDDRK